MRCTLTIDGTADLVSDYISTLEFRESMDELDSLVVQLTLPRGEGMAALVTQLKPGVAWKLELGDRTAEGDIVRVSLRRGSSVPYQVTLVGLEKLHRLRNKRLSEVKEQTRDAAVKALLDAVGVSAQVQGVKPSAAEMVFLDDDMLRMLKHMCRERNFALYWAGGKVSFAPRNQPAAGAATSLVWGYDVIDASLDADFAPLVTKVTMHGRDYRKATEALSYAADKAGLKVISGGKTGVELRQAALGAQELVLPLPLSMASASALEETAVAILQRRGERFIRGTLRCTWHPELAPSVKVEVEGAEWPFMGPFLVHAATHALSSYDGYSTNVEFFSDSYPGEP